MTHYLRSRDTSREDVKWRNTQERSDIPANKVEIIPLTRKG